MVFWWYDFWSILLQNIYKIICNDSKKNFYSLGLINATLFSINDKLIVLNDFLHFLYVLDHEFFTGMTFD